MTAVEIIIKAYAAFEPVETKTQHGFRKQVVRLHQFPYALPTQKSGGIVSYATISPLDLAERGPLESGHSMRARFYSIAILSWLVCVVLMVFDPQSAEAAEWSAQPSVRAGREYNDNAQLTIQPHNSVTGSMIAPRLDLGVSSDIWAVAGNVEAVQKRYSGQSGLDTDDRYFNLMTSYNNTERSTWQVGGLISKNSTLANEQISATTGLVQVQKAYDTHSVTPSWTWAMNELTQLQLAYSFSSVSYVDAQNIGLYDYSTRGISAQLVTQLNPIDQIFLSTGYSIFNVPATTLETKSVSYQAGITRTFSETMRGTFSAGTLKTSSEQSGPVCTVILGTGQLAQCAQVANVTLFSKGTSTTFNGSLEKKYETISLNVSVNRAIMPSGLGVQVRTDSQNVTLSKKFASTLTGNIAVNNYESKSETVNIPSVASHFYTVEPGLRWMWAEEWTVDFSYRYTHIKRATEGEPASSDAAYLTVRYAWPKTNFSR